MFSDPRARKPFILALTVSALILVLVLGTQFALANKQANPIPQETTLNSPTGYGDDGIYEVGVDWMNVFPNPADNRDYWNVSCDGVYNWLVGRGWTPRFRWVNYDAYEKDFKRGSVGGWESSYADNVDLAMACTHGSYAYDNKWQKVLSAVYFGSTQADQYLSPGEAYLAYGDKDLEFLAFDSCSVLEDSSLIYWASTMNGLHLLLGFSNNMHVDPYGDGFLWGYFMTSPYPLTVAQAWFSAIDINQPSWVCARILGESLNNYNEYWWNTWPDPVVDSEKWIWSHCSYGLIYGQNTNEQAKVISVPVVQVLDRTVNEDYVRNNIAPAFNLNGEIIRDDMFYIMADTSGGITRTLLVDPSTGSYRFQNQSELWTVPVITPTLPSERDAGILIYNWFNDTPAKGLPGAGYRNSGFYYNPESIYNQLLSNKENGDLQGQVTRNIPVDVSMTYPRVITVNSETTGGIQQVNYPIFGAGARTVIYLGDGGDIIGAQGGSRDVQVMGDTVTILDPNVVWDMFLANPSLSIGEIPIVADTITHTIPTFGYYEMPYYVHQDELIPVWEFRSYFYLNGNLVAEDFPIYIPAAAYYMPPQVEILSPTDGSTFFAGQPIVFEGAVTGGAPPYTYKWTSSSDGYLGNTLNLISGLGSAIRSSTVFETTVSIQVTDANGLTGTATITLTINPALWMPWINK